MVTFYQFPRGNWRHVRTTNVIKSPFAAMRLRTDTAKRLIEVFALDGRGAHHLVGKRGNVRFGPHVEPQRFHPAEVSALQVAHARERARQSRVVPGEPRPLRPVMDPCHIHRNPCGEYYRDTAIEAS